MGGKSALRMAREWQKNTRKTQILLKAPTYQQNEATLKNLLEGYQKAKEKLQHYEEQDLVRQIKHLKTEIKEENKLQYLIKEVNIGDAKGFKALYQSLMVEKDFFGVLVVRGEKEGSVLLAVVVGKSLVAKHYDARKIFDDIGHSLDARGGGPPFLASGGGKYSAKGLQIALQKSR